LPCPRLDLAGDGNPLRGRASAVASVFIGIGSARQAARNAELLENPPPAALWDELIARQLVSVVAPIPT
jgi:hypothetical protein